MLFPVGRSRIYRVLLSSLALALWTTIAPTRADPNDPEKLARIILAALFDAESPVKWANSLPEGLDRVPEFRVAVKIVLQDPRVVAVFERENAIYETARVRLNQVARALGRPPFVVKPADSILDLRDRVSEWRPRPLGRRNYTQLEASVAARSATAGPINDDQFQLWLMDPRNRSKYLSKVDALRETEYPMRVPGAEHLQADKGFNEWFREQWSRLQQYQAKLHVAIELEFGGKSFIETYEKFPVRVTPDDLHLVRGVYSRYHVTPSLSIRGVPITPSVTMVELNEALYRQMTAWLRTSYEAVNRTPPTFSSPKDARKWLASLPLSTFPIPGPRELGNRLSNGSLNDRVFHGHVLPLDALIELRGLLEIEGGTAYREREYRAMQADRLWLRTAVAGDEGLLDEVYRAVTRGGRPGPFTGRLTDRGGQAPVSRRQLAEDLSRPRYKISGLRTGVPSFFQIASIEDLAQSQFESAPLVRGEIALRLASHTRLTPNGGALELPLPEGFAVGQIELTTNHGETLPPTAYRLERSTKTGAHVIRVLEPTDALEVKLGFVADPAATPEITVSREAVARMTQAAREATLTPLARALGAIGQAPAGRISLEQIMQAVSESTRYVYKAGTPPRGASEATGPLASFAASTDAAGNVCGQCINHAELAQALLAVGGDPETAGAFIETSLVRRGDSLTELGHARLAVATSRGRAVFDPTASREPGGIWQRALGRILTRWETVRAWMKRPPSAAESAPEPPPQNRAKGPSARAEANYERVLTKELSQELAALEKPLLELGRDLPSDPTHPKSVAWRAFYGMKRRLSGDGSGEEPDVTPEELVRTRKRMEEMARRSRPSAHDTRLAELLGRLGQLAVKMSDPSCARRIAAGVGGKLAQ